MSKILCIPDVHSRKFWRGIIYNNIEKVDKVVFIGDYLDPYPEEIRADKTLMECESFDDITGNMSMLVDILILKKSNPDKVILLTGNHTDSYIWSDFSAATRTDYKNWKEYHNFFLENLNYFNLVWIEDDVIFSHAGISEGWADNFLYLYMKYDEGAELERNSITFETARVLKDTPLSDFNKHYINAISHISRNRGGDNIYGSCEWADIKEHIDVEKSITKIIPKGEKGIYQVFGHTQLIKQVITDKWACLDCRRGFIINTVTHEIEECQI